MSFYTQYSGRCMGRLIHFMSHYNRNISDAVCFGGNKVELWGKPFAEITWCERFGEADVPHFNFIGYEGEFHERQQAELRQEAIDDAIIYRSEPQNQEKVSETVLRALIPNEYQSAKLHFSFEQERAEKYYSCTEPSKLEFYVAERPIFPSKETNIYFETAFHRYCFDRSIEPRGAWLLDGMFFRRENGKILELRK